MSGLGGSSGSSKKLAFLLLCLAIVGVLFALIVGIGYLLYESHPVVPGPSGNDSNNTPIGIDQSYFAREGSLATAATDGGTTRTSLFRSIVLVLSTDEGARWLNGNPNWRLFKAQTDYVNGDGLAKHWTLVFRSPDSLLIAYVDNGIGRIQSTDDYAVGDAPLREAQMLQDSNYLINNVTRSRGIDSGANALFSLVFDDDEAGGVYRLAYADPVNAEASFTQAYRATNGEAIESAT